MKLVCGVLAVFGVALAMTVEAPSAQQASSGARLATVKARGILRCGVSASLAGFMAPDDQGKWTGLNVDIGHAIATAALGDGRKVTFPPLSARQGFPALQSGEVDASALASVRTAKALNIDEKWALNAIETVGGYGEMFERHVGRNTPLKLERGQNDLWLRGGPMYAMSFR